MFHSGISGRVAARERSWTAANDPSQLHVRDQKSGSLAVAPLLFSLNLLDVKPQVGASSVKTASHGANTAGKV